MMVDDADKRLDLLLDTWARHQRLEQRQADEIRLAITGQPDDALAATWWTDLSAQISAAVVLATTRPSTPLGMPGATTAAAAGGARRSGAPSNSRCSSLSTGY
jgi:hypothetical protein